MGKIWLTSDTHFCHDRDFVWKERGFSSVDEMNEEIVRRWNSVVGEEDIVYHLGDIMLNDNEKGIKLFSRLNGHINIVLGNHDTQNRIKIYSTELKNVDTVCGYATTLRYKKKIFYLSHYPTITGNGEGNWWDAVVNLHGHTHQKNSFTEGQNFMYHVGMDSHNCYPVLLDDIIKEIKERHEENND